MKQKIRKKTETNNGGLLEQWKPVNGYEGLYSVSNLGRVRNDLTRKRSVSGAIIGSVGNHGYPVVSLCSGGNPQPKMVHTLVLEAFIGPRPLGKQCNHKNGIRHDNCVNNLEWVTCSENIKHMYDVLGNVGPRGSRQGRSILTEKQVVTIRRLHGLGGKTHGELALMFGCSRPTVSFIVARKTWTHV